MSSYTTINRKPQIEQLISDNPSMFTRNSIVPASALKSTFEITEPILDATNLQRTTSQFVRYTKSLANAQRHFNRVLDYHGLQLTKQEDGNYKVIGGTAVKAKAKVMRASTRKQVESARTMVNHASAR